MELIHITQTKNVESIMKNGILRCKPSLPQYADIMEEEYGNDYDKDRGLIFCIPEEINRRDKYIKDFFYWKTWGDDRNIFIKNNIDKYDDINEDGPKVFSHIKPKPLYFSIILLDIPDEPILKKYHHVQTHTIDPLWSDMDIRYEHNQKP